MKLRTKHETTKMISNTSSKLTSRQLEQLSVETNPEILTQGILNRLRQRIHASGEIVLPSVPALLNCYVESLATLFDSLSKTFSTEELEQLRSILSEQLEIGFRTSPHSNIVVRYEPDQPPSTCIVYHVTPIVSTLAEQYKQWVNTREPPLFGNYPDAKVMHTAVQLGDPATVPVLDIGAGTGRNTLPLARLGYSVDVLELTLEFTEQIQTAAIEEGLIIKITQGDILDPLIRMRPAYYRLAILSEVVTHFRDSDQVRLLLAKMCDALRSGGLLLFSVFIAEDCYELDEMTRQMSQVTWSYIITRSQLREAMEELPIKMLSDESVLNYERTHLPAEAWPPTGWFVNWASGQDVFGLYDRQPPIELRWLLFERR